MKLIREIYHSNNIDKNGKILEREAVRAIIKNSNMILLIHSEKNGDYKFPGGGIESNENKNSALEREMKEECGIEKLEIKKDFGKVIEYSNAREDNYNTFKMTSYYYICGSGEIDIENLTLDEYEKELGFTPQWVDLDVALNNNLQLLKKRVEVPLWVKRDTSILTLLKNEKE